MIYSWNSVIFLLTVDFKSGYYIYDYFSLARWLLEVVNLTWHPKISAGELIENKHIWITHSNLWSAERFNPIQKP